MDNCSAILGHLCSLTDDERAQMFLKTPDGEQVGANGAMVPAVIMVTAASADVAVATAASVVTAPTAAAVPVAAVPPASDSSDKSVIQFNPYVNPSAVAVWNKRKRHTAKLNATDQMLLSPRWTGS